MKIRILKDIPGLKAGEVIEVSVGTDLFVVGVATYNLHALKTDGFAEEVKDEIPEDDPRWRAKEGRSYSLVDCTGILEQNNESFSEFDNLAWYMGMSFPSDRLAEGYVKRRKAYMRYIRKIAEINARTRWKCDWSDRRQCKYYLLYDRCSKRTDISFTFNDQTMPTELYFYPGPDPDAADNVLRACREDYKIYLGVE